MMELKKYFLTGMSCLFFALLNAQVPEFDWAIHLEANGQELIRTEHVAVDQEGNIYVSGEMFSSGTGGATIDFSSGTGFKILNSANGNRFLAKYDKDWNLLWAESWEDAIVITDLTIGIDTNLIFTGDFSSTRDFQIGDGEFIVENDFSRDLFIGKMDGNGNVIWITSSDTESGSAVDVLFIDTDNDGNIYQSGSFSGTVDFANGDEIFELTATTNNEDYVAKYDTNGDLIFVKTIVATNNFDFVFTGFSVEPISGDIFFTGRTYDFVDLDPDPVIEVSVFVDGSYSVITKWSSQGEYQWHKFIAGTDDLGLIEDVKALSDGTVVMAGRYTGSANLDPEGTDTIFTAEPDAINSFILKRSADGTLLEVHSISSQIVGSSADPDIWLSDIEIDHDDGIYIYGEYKGIVDFDLGNGEELRTSPSQQNSPSTRDKFFVKYDQDLNFDWFTRLSENTGNTNLTKRDFKVDNEKSLITVAEFPGALVFPGYTFSQNFGDSFSDALIHKIKQCRYDEAVVESGCDSYDFNGQNLTESGSYDATFTSSLGCDSLVTLDLTLFQSQSSASDVTACSDYEWGLTGDIFNEDGSYSTTLTTTQGCDSIVTVNLTLQDEIQNLQESACEEYTWVSNGETYTESGIYQVTLQNETGCDSTIVLDLTLFSASSSVQEVTACEFYLWEPNNNSYDESGSYETNLFTVNGCDSLVTLNLTILDASESSQSAQACSSFLWDLTGVEYLESGVYEAVLMNEAGCDSIISLDLDILSDEIDQFENACGQYEWPVNGEIYLESGVYSESFTNMEGCDSIISLNLEIIDVNTEVTVDGIELSAEAAGADFQWVDCNNNFAEIDGEQGDTFIPSQNGLYAVIVTQLGCSETSECISVTTVDVANLNGIESKITLFPNPTKGEFVLVLDGEEFETIRCFDIHGRLIKDFSGDQGMRYDLDRENGLYIIRVVLKNGSEAALRLVLID